MLLHAGLIRSRYILCKTDLVSANSHICSYSLKASITIVWGVNYWINPWLFVIPDVRFVCVGILKPHGHKFQNTSITMQAMVYIAYSNSIMSRLCPNWQSQDALGFHTQVHAALGLHHPKVRCLGHLTCLSLCQGSAKKKTGQWQSQSGQSRAKDPSSGQLCLFACMHSSLL